MLPAVVCNLQFIWAAAVFITKTCRGNKFPSCTSGRNRASCQSDISDLGTKEWAAEVCCWLCGSVLFSSLECFRVFKFVFLPVLIISSLRQAFISQIEISVTEISCILICLTLISLSFHLTAAGGPIWLWTRGVSLNEQTSSHSEYTHICSQRCVWKRFNSSLILCKLNLISGILLASGESSAVDWLSLYVQIRSKRDDST